jgi:formylglycine-generating enzyme required for sulfatase activity
MVLRGSNRVNRGGSWGNDAANCRTANRNTTAPTNRTNDNGFRLALNSAGIAVLAQRGS